MGLLNFVALALFALSAHRAPADEWVDRSPHRSGSAVLDGITLHYLDWGGTGEPMLLLSGPIRIGARIRWPGPAAHR